MPGKSKQVYKAIKPVEPRTRNLVLWLDAHGKKHTEPAGPAIVHEPFEFNRRAREPVHYRGQRHRPGLYWFAQLNRHVWHESMLEKWALTFLDFLSPVEAVIPQPCLLQFEDGTHHWPDYFVLHADGTRAVLDVHFDGLVNDRVRQQFANTQKVCESIGWKYEIFTGIDQVLLKNVLLLSLYRHPRWAPPVETADELLHSTPGLSFEQVLDNHPTTAPVVITSQLYHLLWTGQLAADLTTPLNDNTVLQKGI